MSRDVKLGMLFGLVIVAIALIVISVWPGSMVQDRLRRHGDRPVPEKNETPAPPVEPPADNHVPRQTPGPTPPLRDAAIEAVETVHRPPSPPAPRIHIVARDENLSTIAQLHYGDAAKWTLIAEANKDILPDVNRLRPGMRLTIPLPQDN